MRRVLVLIVTVLTVGSLTGSAAASTLRVRLDANDSSSKLDIHKVITNLSDTTMYLRLRSWDRFKPREVRQDWAFSLDTFGSPHFDRYVDIAPVHGGIVCTVMNLHTQNFIGHRAAARPDRRSAACHLPRGWFGDIARAVRFQASISGHLANPVPDTAPNHGVYRWI